MITTLHPKKRKFFFFLLPILLIALFFSFGCTKQVDYFSYVSELRDNVLLCENGEFQLRVYATRKESPYSLDGIKRDMQTRAEIFLIAPSIEKTCSLSFTVDGKTHQGEFSADNVKMQYYFACEANLSALESLQVSVTCENQQTEFTAVSVRTQNTLSPQEALSCICQSESELISAMTDKYGFAGEIYLRLLYEDFPYYYVGIIDREGKTHAFLLNGETGKTLAKREI